MARSCSPPDPTAAERVVLWDPHTLKVAEGEVVHGPLVLEAGRTTVPVGLEG